MFYIGKQAKAAETHSMDVVNAFQTLLLNLSTYEKKCKFP